MGALDKVFDILKMNDGEDDYYSDDDYYQESSDDTEKSGFFLASSKDDSHNEDKSIIRPNRSNQSKRKGNINMEVVRIEPTSVEDGRKIAQLLLDNRVVFLDLEGIDMNLAQRILDFVSGASFAIDGKLQKMSRYTFVIAPPAVNVSGDFSAEEAKGDSQVLY